MKRAVGIFAGALFLASIAPLGFVRAAGQASASDAVTASLTGAPGNAANGRTLATARDRGNCIACHVLPAPDEATHGNMGPSLKGVADRLSEAQLRARIIDARKLNPASIMPSYHLTEGLHRVAKGLEGKPVLSASEVEDMVAFLLTLHEGKPAR